MKTITQNLKKTVVLFLFATALFSTSYVRATEITVTEWTQNSLSAEFTELTTEDKALVTKITIVHETTTVTTTDLTYIRDNFPNLTTLDLSGVDFFATTFPQVFGVGGNNQTLADNPYIIESISLPKNVTTIGNAAFKNCQELKTVVLPSTVITINFYAFSNCPKLININTENVTTYGSPWTFYGCSSLTSFTFNPNVTSIPAQMLRYCTALEKITLPTGDFTILAVNAFADCPALTKVICLATTPPTVTGTFSPAANSNCKLYVPTASVDTYKESTLAPWSTFLDENIFPIDDLLNDVNASPSSENILIYPNPVRESFSLNARDIQRVEVISITGQVLKTYHSPMSTYSVEGLKTGNYFVRVHTAKDSNTFKIVVNN